ncbi:MAG: FKBP-type peptidyl-prolyl cis-trans isomerase [Balneolaceae bacterium]
MLYLNINAKPITIYTTLKKSLFNVTFYLVLLVFVFSSCKKDDGCTSEPNLQVSQEQLALDIAAIDAYLTENEINAQTDDTGLRYVITNEGTGAKADLCSIATVTYAGKLMTNGTVFDSRDIPISFPLRNLITGWQIGIPKVKSGGSITLYIPSVYAYGARENGDIPANSNLIFEITVMGVR